MLFTVLHYAIPFWSRKIPFIFFFASTISLPKCGKGKPALARRNPLENRNELIACIENGNFAKAARIVAGM